MCFFVDRLFAMNWDTIKDKGFFVMNWDIIKGNWRQVSGKVKEKWGKLTDDDLTAIDGKREQLVGVLQKKYGYAKDKIDKEIDEFTRTCNC